MNSDRIFTSWDGDHGHPDWPSQWFSKFIAAKKLPPLNFHGLRHTHATLLINQNVPIKNVSGRMGHSNIGTTGDIYSHYLTSSDEAISQTLQTYYDTRIKQVQHAD